LWHVTLPAPPVCTLPAPPAAESRLRTTPDERPNFLLPTAARRAAGLTLALLVAACSSPGSAPNTPSAAQPGDGVRRDPVVAGRPARVFVMGGFGEGCESLDAPTMKVLQQPAKGSVSFEPGQETTINSSASGTCIGQRVRGTGIYYTA